jgi:hypothetical protein
MIMRRRAMVGRRGPGLVGTAARTAVVAGTATAVSGSVRRRQDERQGEAEQQAAYQEQQQAAPEPAPAPQAAPAPAGDTTAELERLAALKQQGVLSDEEFAAAKAKILGL